MWGGCPHPPADVRTVLAETLNFLRYLKTKDNQAREQSKALKSKTNTQINSTRRSLLEHLKTIGKCEGDDERRMS